MVVMPVWALIIHPITTTAEALLALTDIPADSKVQAALEYLNKMETPIFRRCL